MSTPHLKVIGICVFIIVINVVMVIDQKEQAATMRNKLISLDGDHMMLVNIYRAYKAVKGNKVNITYY